MVEAGEGQMGSISGDRLGIRADYDGEVT
jgi:hypothetical protein